MDSTSDRLSQKSFPSPPHGRRVVWSGKRRPAVEGAPFALPGVVTQDLPDGWTLVSWLDKDGEYEGRDFIHPDFVRAADEAEAQRLTTQRRESEWTGLDRT